MQHTAVLGENSGVLKPVEDETTDVIERLVAAMNAHDLDATSEFIAEDYRSESRRRIRSCTQDQPHA